ncbi:MAG: PaaI family thioesterase [Gammaproteobacteria bacterium]|nr:PaaI family thioesterase [Gammaproteobacteria bacterium]
MTESKRSASNDTPLAELRKTMSGLDYVEALRDQRIPLAPMARTIGYHFKEVRKGRVTLAVTPGRHLFNNWTLHGGAMATILDSAMSAAVNSEMPVGARCRTLELKINYLDGPTAETGELLARASTIQVRNRIALAQGKLEDDEGKLYAHATATFSIRR